MSESENNSPKIEHSSDQLIQHIADCVQKSPAGERTIVGIAGPPASGKSTLLTSLVAALNDQFGASRVAGVPMDGFHLDNATLKKSGDLSRKGAPHTFSVFGLLSMIKRLARNESPIYAPEFDRARDLSRNCAIKMGSMHDIVLIEGNYLLLNRPQWRDIAQYLHLSISIDVPDTVLHKRLVQRWLDHGLSADDALLRAESNDLQNAQTVRDESVAADIVYRPSVIEPTQLSKHS